MIVEIDHILLAAPDPDAAAADLGAALGLAPAGGGVHEAIGTRNALLSLGGPYLELIGLRDDARATRELALRHPIGSAVVRALDGLAGRLPARCAYVTVALRSDDVAADVARLRASASAPAPAPALSTSEVVRRRPDGSIVRWPVAFPARLGPQEPPFLIEHAPDEPERAARLRGGGPALRALGIAASDPVATARGWAAVLGLAGWVRPAARAGDGGTSLALALGGHTVVLSRDGRPPGSATVRIVDPAGGGARVVERGGLVVAVD